MFKIWCQTYVFSQQSAQPERAQVGNKVLSEHSTMVVTLAPYHHGAPPAP